MRRSALALCLWTALASCAEERGAIDRVQANALRKADLDGEWYFVQTVIDVPYTTEFTFIGDQSELEKIRWVIQEKFLVAHRTYERFEGSEQRDELGRDYLGAPVAAYSIESHFDIKHDYNPTTGEEINIVVENTTDRPWYEREYMRVDWSTNLVTNWSFWADKVSLEPIATYANDECAATGRECDDRPVFEDGYMDFTHRFLASPGQIDDPDWGTFPTCWLYYSFDDCTAQQIEVRASFMRVPDSDYEPLVWTDHDQELFGYFDVQRYGYDDQYGPVESRRVRYATRWDIWQTSHTDEACASDDECTGGRCDEVRGLCTVPYAEREPKPIVYHVGPGTSAEDAQVLSGIADEWSAALRDTVNGVRENECLNGGGSAEACAGLRDETLAMFILCPNNPVQEGDPAECGAAGTAPRIGDMRYSFMYMVQKPQLGSPLGYGPSLPDPETGEIVSASAFVYGPELDTYSAWARDLVALLNGEIDVDDYIMGVNVEDWVAAQGEGGGQEARRARTLTPDEIRGRRERMSLDWAAALPRVPAARNGRAKDPRALSRARQAVQSSGILAAHGPGGAARLASLRGTPVEAQMVNAEMLLAAGMDPTSAPTEEVVRRASPLGRMSPAALRAVTRARRERNAHRCVWFRDFSDPGAVGWALEHRGEDPEEARKIIRAAVLRSVMAHEVGHTIGLRHNFEGSYDALNYPAEYWALRDDGTMQPRYLDPETDEELEGNIREVQYSTVMDYSARFNSDVRGIGHYDLAAVKFGYGKLMEVFPNVTGADADIANVLVLYTNFGWPMPLLYDSDDALVGLHYTEYPTYFGDLEDRRDVFWDDLGDFYGDAEWFESPITHLATATGEPIVPYRFCSDEFEGASVTCSVFDEGADLYEVTADRIDRYRNYYIFDAFKRDRVNFNPEPYVWRVYERYLEPLQNLNQWYVLLVADLLATEEPTDNVPRFLERPDGFGPLTVAVGDAFQTFAETLTMPEPGTYHLDVRGDGTEWLAPWGEDFEVPLTEGRWLETTWDFDSGYYWDDKVLRVGYFVDKALAMELMADPTTWFLGRDTAADIRQYQISFYSNFRDQMVDLFGGLMGDRIDRIAPYEDANGNLQRRDYTDPTSVIPPGATPIDPQTGFTVQLFASVYGMTMMSDNFDTKFIDSARVYLEGSGQGFTPLFERVTFDDPYGGKRYVAQSFPDEDGVERGVAAGVIAEANALLAIFQDEGASDEERARADAALRNYVDNLDLMRQIGEYLDLGPSSIWE
ncbi:MAG: zinc-dependent metalloprotease [Deltaproteobacteria bacterium]|nr:zinc-dependent metalloprotease [Deltaproteobacteria bacterium]